MGTPTGRSHQITLVTLDEQAWIVDVGFGSNTPRAPLPFILNQVIQTDLQTFRFVEDAQFGYFLQVLSTDGTDTWNNLYSFDLEFVFAGDIACGNFFYLHFSSFAFYQRKSRGESNRKWVGDIA